MERKILFKARSKKNGAWVEGLPYKHEPPLVCFAGEGREPSKWYILKTAFADWHMPRQVESVEIVPATLCQYTGEVDKNKRRVFEADIVRAPDGEEFVVSWVMGSAAWGLTNNTSHCLVAMRHLDLFEVVSSVYDD